MLKKTFFMHFIEQMHHHSCTLNYTVTFPTPISPAHKTQSNSELWCAYHLPFKSDHTAWG
jgi:hypothetical protein